MLCSSKALAAITHSVIRILSGLFWPVLVTHPVSGFAHLGFPNL
ncbi:hypothetical protein B6N60_04601 [Richelia sinica FACHB-800]|uniref:Uncharacterized protein n=1 Tax=Richelia sinica FACHB-800 TaxID=1357546 RepID=A0A975TBQ7_9NOST|nr:hypothetical protein B6N60_04601 [Richelia sinica FACHB-800]